MSLIKVLAEKLVEKDVKAQKVFDVLCKYARDFIEINDDTTVETVLDWYRKHYSETRIKEATSISELRQELTQALVDRVGKEVLNEVLKDATLADMTKELRTKGVHPAEIINIITGTQNQDSSLVIYFDSRIYDVLRRHCNYPEAKAKLSVKDLLKYLAYRLIEADAETALTQHALQLQEYLPQENKDVLDKA